MNIYAIKGHEVRGIPESSYFGNSNIVEDTIYTIDYTNVHSSSTDVYLLEFPGKVFNSVLFEDVVEQSLIGDVNHKEYFRFVTGDKKDKIMEKVQILLREKKLERVLRW